MHTHTHSKVRKIFSVYPTESCDRRTREESTGKMTRDYRDSSKVKVLASSWPPEFSFPGPTWQKEKQKETEGENWLLQITPRIHTCGTCTHPHIYAHTHTHTYTYVYIHTHTYVCVCTHCGLWISVIDSFFYRIELSALFPLDRTLSGLNHLHSAFVVCLTKCPEATEPENHGMILLRTQSKRNPFTSQWPFSGYFITAM